MIINWFFSSSKKSFTGPINTWNISFLVNFQPRSSNINKLKMHFTHSFLVCCVKNKTKINYKLCIENGLLGFLTILTHTRTMFPLWMSSQSISNPLFINVSSPLWISTLPWWRGLYFQLLGSPRIKNASHERQINNDRNTA